MKKSIALMLCAVLILLIGCEAEINESVPESIVDSQDASGTAESSETSEVGDDSSAPDDTSEPTVIKDEYYEGYTGSKKELALKLDYGTEDEQIAMGDAFTKRNAEGFLIYGGEYHILDSVAHRIAVFDESGEFLRSIDFKEYSEVGVPFLFAYSGKEYAVILYSATGIVGTTPEITLLYIDENGKKYSLDIDKWLVENNIELGTHYTFNYLRFEDDILHIVNCAEIEGVVRFSDDGIDSIEAVEPELKSKWGETNIIYTTGNGSFTLTKDEIAQKASSIVCVYGVNGNIYVYELYLFSKVEPRFNMVECRISEYSPKGELVQYAIIEEHRDLIGDPDKPYYICENGDLYYMYSLEDGVYIYRVEMGNTAISPAQYLYHQLDE